MRAGPGTVIMQEPVCGGGDRPAAAIPQQEDEARAPGDDDQGRHSARIEWPEHRAEEGTQEKPGKDHRAHPILTEGVTDVRRAPWLTAERKRGGPGLGSLAHHAVQPPSTTRFEPVMYDEASDARNSSAPQYSSRCAILPSGARLL